MNAVKTIRHNEYVKSAIVIAVIVGVVLGFFFGLALLLNTSVPVRVVESGSMCVPYNITCDGWSHPFDQTLHVGDIIVIQGVDPKDININYPNSDIIVYLNPDNTSATPIVHRVVERYEVNGTLYFQTKGDGNGQKWPADPSPADYDSSTLWGFNGKGVPQNLVVGRVVMHIPWFGHLALFMQTNPWRLPLVIALIIVLVIVEFVIPVLKKKKPQFAVS